MTEFIFMLTHHDATVPDALAVYDAVRDTGLRWIGFKDVGQPVDVLRELTRRMHCDGRSVVLEVVSLDEASEARSASVGVDLGVDLLMGGTRPDVVAPLLRGTGIRYFPFPGRIVGHPSVLTGTVDEIAASAAAMRAMPGVDGLDLLAYRFDGDVPALIRAVVGASGGPVVAAGSIDSLDRIRLVGELGCWGFTIGGAIFEARLPAPPEVRDQVVAALEAAGRAGATGAGASGVDASSPVTGGTR